MKQAVAEQWITALRSDEYAQCTGQLKDDGGYCCLGVLTDIYLKEEVQGEWNDVGTFVYTDELGYERREAFSVPRPVMEWAGLRTEDPTTYDSDDDDNKYATALNDDERWSFTKIAQWIEDNWETL